MQGWLKNLGFSQDNFEQLGLAVYPWPIVRCEIVGGQSLDYKLASHLPWDGIRTACARGVATAACRGTSNRGDCWVMSQAGADPRGRAAPRWLSAGDAVQIDHTITAGTHPNRPADSSAPRAKGQRRRS